MLGGRPPRMEVELTYFVVNDSAIPIASPPTHVRGILENPPIVAAPNA